MENESELQEVEENIEHGVLATPDSVDKSPSHPNPLERATQYSPTGFRRRREGQELPRMDISIDLKRHIFCPVFNPRTII